MYVQKRNLQDQNLLSESWTILSRFLAIHFLVKTFAFFVGITEKNPKKDLKNRNYTPLEITPLTLSKLS